MIITSITPSDENGKRQIYLDGELFAGEEGGDRVNE